MSHIEKVTYKTRGDLIFSAMRVKLMLFQAWYRVSIQARPAGGGWFTGVTDVNMQGWLPSSSSKTESYQPTPKPSPLIGLRRSTRNLESKAWLMIEWHGRVSSCHAHSADEINEQKDRPTWDSWTGEVPLYITKRHIYPSFSLCSESYKTTGSRVMTL